MKMWFYADLCISCDFFFLCEITVGRIIAKLKGDGGTR